MSLSYLIRVCICWMLMGLFASELPLNAQDSNDVKAQAKECISHIHEEEFDAANQCIGQILTSITNQEDSLLVYYLVGNAYRVYIKQGTNNKSLATAGKDLAEKYLNKAIAIGLPTNTYTAKSYFRKALLAKSLGDYATALDAYNKAIQIFESLGDEIYLYHCYSNVGPIHTRFGNVPKALESLEKAKKLAMKSGDQVTVIKMMIEQGILHITQKDYPSAIKVLEAALHWETDLNAMSEQEKGNYTYNKTTLLLTLGGVFLDINEYEKAKKSLEEAQKLSLIIGDNGLSAEIESSLGVADFRQKSFQESQQHFKKALSLLSSTQFPPHRREIGKIFLRMGRLHIANGKPDSALKAFHEALVRVLPLYDPQDKAIPPSRQELYHENVIHEALLGKARSFFLLYEQSGHLAHLQNALAHHERAIHAADRLRKGVGDEFSTLLVSEVGHDRGEEALRIAYLLYEQTGEAAYLEKAFWLMEKNKAWALRRQIHAQQARQLGSTPDALVQEINSLDKEITRIQTSWLQYKGKQSQYAKKIKALAAEDLQKRVIFHQRLDSLRQLYPEFYLLQYGSEIPPPGVLQQRLEPGTVLIEYFFGENTLFALGLSRSQLTLIPIELDSALNQAISGFPELVHDDSWNPRSPSYETFTQMGHLLYQRLVAPLISEETQNLVLAPDGPLGYIPFDALLTEEVQEVLAFAKLPYLLHKTSVWQTYSASLMGEARQDMIRKGLPYLGIAPEYPFGNVRNLEPVFLSQEDVIRMADAWGGHPVTGSDATAEHILPLLPKASILHFFGHAEADDANPEKSWLALSLPGEAVQANSVSDPQASPSLSGKGPLAQDGQKGYLYASELYDLQLQAELTVLSACRTGQGKIARGEGIMSLARAFRYAGCPSVLMTLWYVDEKATARLASGFFQELRKKSGKATAIRSAKLAYLKDPDISNKHPFYWSSFVLIGNNDPVQVPLHWAWYPLLALAFLLLALLGYRSLKT